MSSIFGSPCRRVRTSNESDYGRIRDMYVFSRSKGIRSSTVCKCLPSSTTFQGFVQTPTSLAGLRDLATRMKSPALYFGKPVSCWVSRFFS